MRAKVKVTRTFSTKKLGNLAMPRASTLKFRRDVGPHQQMTPRAKIMVKVTMTFSTKMLDNLGMLGARTFKLRRDVCPHQ